MYIMKINNDKYKCRACSKKNWENGTRNDYMLEINGIKRELKDLKEVMWQLELFRGNSFLYSEYDENYNTEYNLSPEYMRFLEKNKIKYHDRLCNLDRWQYLSGYGYMQGYFRVGECVEQLKETGYIKIPFKWLYDVRQYDNCMNECCMEIKKVEK